MDTILHNFLIWLDSSKYFLLFIGTLFEGPVVMMTSGFFFGLGKFSFLPMYLILVFGDFVADVGWYSIGRFGTRSIITKYGHFIGITPEILEKIENGFLKYHQRILIISKLTMGFGFAVVVLMVAGIFKVPFKNYVILNLLGGFIWTIFLISIGYFIGNIFLIIPKQIQLIFVFIIFILLIICLKYINKYIKTKNI